MGIEDAAPRIAVTKLAPPAAPSTLVPRDQRVAALGRLAEDHPVTLVAAPAGAGKTVLLAEWVRHRPEGSWAWLSCDVTDANSTRFWTSVIAACAQLGEGIGEEARVLLAEDPLALDDVVPSLVNDLARLDRRAALVIDDLHLVPSHAVAPLGLLVERLPPAVALVLGTRSDPPLPLDRWRVNGLLGELRSGELRFSASETAQLVAANGVDLTPDEANTLTERTEGWATGVQLAALTLRGHPNPSGFVRAFAGSTHNVTDYLAGEVLRQLDAETLDFFLATATLDEFDAERCRALTGRHDAADRLEALEAANLFMVRVGTQTGTYRFHHLFRDVLRSWLAARDPDRVKALHATASRWYEQHGDVARAIRHAIDGSDADRAFTLLRDHAISGYLSDAGISAWITELGDEVLSARSDQVLDYIVALILAGWIDEAGRWIAYLDTVAPADPSPRFAARHAMAKANWLGNRGEIGPAVAHAEDAVQRLAFGEDAFVDAAPLTLIRGYDYLDRPTDARAVFRDATDRWAPSPLMQQVLLQGAIATVELECGNLRLAGKLARRAAAAAQRLGAEQHFGASEVMRTLGALEAEAGDLTTAERHLEAALDVAAPGRPPFALLSLLELARVAGRRGEVDEALHRLHRARACLPTGVESALTRRADALEVRIRATAGLEVTPDLLARLGSGARRAIGEAQCHVQRRDPQAAAGCLETLEPGAAEPRPQLEGCLVEAQVALLEGDAIRLDRQLDRLLDLSRSQGFARSITDAGIEITRALDARLRRRAPEPALDALERAVAESSARPVPVARAAAADQSGLTDRELTVLRYLPTRLTNREIASELYVSMNTLKTHLRSTYSKLGVESRAEAIEQAGRLNLL